MSLLTPFQTAFLEEMGRTNLRDSFYLTGGTALAEFYLQHRYSEDLDFFTDTENAVTSALPILQTIATDLQARLEILRNFRTFLSFHLHQNQQVIRCDFAFDSPFRLEDKVFNSHYGIYVDNLKDMACNKLSALYDRNEPKDFVDIYFICQEIFPFPELLTLAKQKHIGMDDYWVAVSLSKVNQIRVLPKMIKPVSIEQLRQFFKEQTERLMR